MLNILLNRGDVALGAELQNFKDFVASFPAGVYASWRNVNYVVSLCAHFSYSLVHCNY